MSDEIKVGDRVRHLWAKVPFKAREGAVLRFLDSTVAVVMCDDGTEARWALKDIAFDQGATYDLERQAKEGQS